ncbi:MAG: hypothetical protein U5L11_04910 [Arhodomonas sp.]|nr:hypothetical protein [Arhodomonas sp.]
MARRTVGEDHMDLQRYLKLMPKHGASDLFFSAGAPVGIRIHGQVRAIEPDRRLDAETVEGLALSILDEAQRAELERELELNLAISPTGIGRFR